MDKKFLILLLATVFYNGVTYSSPVDGKQILEPKPSEEKQPTVDHINTKVEPTAVPSTQPNPVSHNVSVTPAEGQVPTVKNETVHPALASSNTSVPQSVDANKNNTSLLPGKNNTQVVIDNRQSSNVNSTIKESNSTQPAEHVTVPGGVPAVKGITDMPPPPPSEQKSTVSPTTPVPMNKSSSTTVIVEPPITKPSVTTPPPTTTSKESVVIEHNVPAPAEERHFHGPSFIGGIVLTIGLTAIGFIAFKYYKSGKIDMNYRTL